MKKRYYYMLLPLLGVVFGLWYLKIATCDVVYTDYIRLVNEYLPDVFNPTKFFVPDVLTRVPINYLGRIVNTTFFGYWTTFDMILGVLALGLAGYILAQYSRLVELKPGWFLLLMLVMFSLNKWEMLTNGTGWSHFLALACFYYHFVVLDRVVSGQRKNYDQIILIILPFIITIGIAGPYCASYTIVALLAYCLCALFKRKDNVVSTKEYLIYLMSTIIPFLFYLWSNFYADKNHDGVTDLAITEVLIGQPKFFIRFLLKSFASIIIGGEQLQALDWSNKAIYLLGCLVVLGYLLAFWLNIKHRLYKKTILPLMLLVMGMLNHGMILVARWIFLRDHYGMSSRYALQYQVGILGIVLTIGLLWDQLEVRIFNIAVAAIAVMVLLGNSYTTYDELKKAPYREEAFEHMRETAIHFEDISDQDLVRTIGYRTGDPDSSRQIRAALSILKQHQWNIFR